MEETTPHAHFFKVEFVDRCGYTRDYRLIVFDQQDNIEHCLGALIDLPVYSVYSKGKKLDGHTTLRQMMKQIDHSDDFTVSFTVKSLRAKL